MSDLVKQAGFDDDTVPSSRVDNYKAKEGKADRIALAWLSEEPNKKTNKYDPQIVWADSYYVQGKGYILHKPGFDKIIGKQPKKRFGTVVVVFQTDKNGELLKDDNDKPIVSYTVKPWFFSEQKYRDLKSLHNKWDLSQHDLDITCIEEQYQNLTIQPHPNSYFQKLMEKERHRTKLVDQIQQVIDTLESSLGREVTESELKSDVLEQDIQSGNDSDFNDSSSEDVLDDILDDIE